MLRLGMSGGSHYMGGQTTQDKCPWCQHEKCEEVQFDKLWLGCCTCGITASKQKWEEVKREQLTPGFGIAGILGNCEGRGYRLIVRRLSQPK